MTLPTAWGQSPVNPNITVPVHSVQPQPVRSSLSYTCEEKKAMQDACYYCPCRVSPSCCHDIDTTLFFSCYEKLLHSVWTATKEFGMIILTCLNLLTRNNKLYVGSCFSTPFDVNCLDHRLFLHQRHHPDYRAEKTSTTDTINGVSCTMLQYEPESGVRLNWFISDDSFVMRFQRRERSFGFWSTVIEEDYTDHKRLTSFDFKSQFC
ncbi:hypothetical protein P9112_009606 [Eukaryota sp. TZLM1-RC]